MRNSTFQCVCVVSLTLLATAMTAEQSIVQIGALRAVVVTPDGFDETKSHKIALGLSGGDQNQGIVEYCTEVYFTPPQLSEAVLIAPINDGQGNFRDYSHDKLVAMFDAIDAKFKNNGKWLIMGTSNGGVGTFNAIAADPARFEGAVVMPGASNVEITKEWRHLNVMFGVGSEDGAWQVGSDNAQNELNAVGAVTGSYTFEGQGHILPQSYDVAPIFDAYFALGK